MKDNKLFSAMGNIDEELIEEAVNAPKKKGLPVLRITAAAAALVFIALSAAILVNVSRQPDMIAETTVSDARSAENPSDTKQEVREKKDEDTASALNGGDNADALDAQNDRTVQPASDAPEVKTSDTEQPEIQTSEQVPAELPNTEDEGSDMLGFVVTDDGKVYMQVFGSTEYTLDKDIGRAGDFKGCYYGLEDNSRIYTVKENDNILVVKFESGGSVVLMLREEGLQDRMGYYRFCGLRVDSSLMAALSSNDGKAYSVNVSRPDSDDMYDYVYNGKTLRQMKEELDESWKTEHGKYNPLDEEYQAALDAFLREKIRAVYDILIENGIQAEIINGVRCEMTMTREQFEALGKTNSYLDEYAFGLSAGNYFAFNDPDA